LLHIAVQDHEPGFCHLPESTRGGLEPRADVDGLPGPPATPRRVTGEHPLVGANDTEPRVCRRLAMTVEEILRPGQPGTYRRHQGGVEEQVHRDADGGPGGSNRVMGLQERGVRALPCLDAHIQMAGRIGDLPEHR
jgi:hypothetical protein